MVNSRAKGCRGELELARWLGGNARRGQQYSGTSVSADVVGALAAFLIEVKRYARIAPLKWLWRAQEDAKRLTDNPKPAIVFMREDGDKRWVVMMTAEDFMDLYRKAYPDETSD